MNDSPAPDEIDENSTTNRKTKLFVGIGASAGGLEAIRELAKNLSTQTNATYIVAQHMAPTHPSLMTPLVASETKLPVSEAIHGEVPQAGHIYITPPNSDVEVEDGKLILSAPSSELGMPKPSVDRLFQSLARDCGDNSMGIILSGTGTDGAYGSRAIHEVGGIVLAQDAESAKYDGMPRAAQSTGCVDLVLSPSEMGNHFSRIIESRDQLSQFKQDSDGPSDFLDLMQILFARTGVDFRDYKPSTVMRRIDRRKVAVNIPDIPEYTAYCQSHPTELDLLFKDLLISVTRFFRDPEEFEKIREIVGSTVKEAGDAPIRIWAAGCATGEEAYSIAMLLAEALGGPVVAAKANVQIFASDLDERALAQARSGKYPATALKDVPEEYRSKYLHLNGDMIEVDPQLRKLVLFAAHNVCTDAPFLKLDLIICRNLLIYLRASMQRKVLSRMHYALKNDGALFLGNSESASVTSDLFEPVADHRHIFRKRTGSAVSERSTIAGFTPLAKVRSTALDSLALNHQDQVKGLNKEVEALEAAFGPMTLKVLPDNTIVKVRGDWSGFFVIQDSITEHLSTRMLKPPLDQEAYSLILLASSRKVVRTGVVHRDLIDGGRVLRLTAYPVYTGDTTHYIVLSLDQWEQTDTVDVSHGSGDMEPESQGVVATLRAELSSARESLQHVIEELETSNEELQALNEELQSSNEELQASNEELETTNEELQSSNEELITVNEELNVNSEELLNLNAELEAIVENLGAGVLVVDAAIQLKHANKQALATLGIEELLIGSHLSALSVAEGFQKLSEICAETIKVGKLQRQDMVTGDRIVNMVTTPIFALSGRSIGCAVLLSDTTENSRLSAELSHILKHAGLGIIHRKHDGTILRISDFMAAKSGGTPEELIGKNLHEIVPEGMARKFQLEVDDLLESDHEYSISEPFALANEPDHWVVAHRTGYADPISGEKSVYSFITDVTQQKDSERLYNRRAALSELLEERSGTNWIGHDLQTGALEISAGLSTLLGVAQRHWSAEDAKALHHCLVVNDDLKEWQRVWAMTSTDPVSTKVRFIARDRPPIPANLTTRTTYGHPVLGDINFISVELLD